MKMRGMVVGVLCALATAVGASPSEADIIFTQAPSGTGNNVLFQCPPADAACIAELSDGDKILVGTIENTDFQVQFEANVNIQPDAAGQAVIEEVNDADLFTSLQLSFLNFNSTNELVLRVKPAGRARTTANIQFVACNQFFQVGTTDPVCETSQIFTSTAPAGDFFTLTVADGQLITSVRVLATNGSLDEVEQVRVGDLFDDNDVIVSPEPATVLLMGVGFLVSGYKVRRRIRAKAA